MDAVVLANSRDALSRRSAEVAAELAAARRTARRWEKQHLGKLSLLEDVCFVLFVLCCPDASVARSFWTSKTESLVCPSPEELLQKLEARYLSTKLSDLQIVLDGGGQRNVHAAAMSYLQQHRLHHWVQLQNHEHGVAPTRRMLAEHIRDDVLRGRDAPTPTGELRSLAAHVKWIQRFRRRWGCRLAVARPGDRLPLTTLRDKVWCQKRSSE